MACEDIWLLIITMIPLSSWMAELEGSRCIWQKENGRKKMGLVNKQQSDPLYLFFLNQHLETKLHLLPPRRDTAARGCMLSTRSKCVNTRSFCVTSIFPSSLFIIILQSRSYLMLSNLAELLWWRNTQTKRCLGHMSCFMETSSS